MSIAAVSLFGRWRAVTQTALQRPTIPKSPGNQGKHRVTKRRAALSNPMFTLVTVVNVKKTNTTYLHSGVWSCPSPSASREYSTNIMSGLDVIALVLFLIIFFLLSKVFYNQKKNKIKNFPPGPNCLPIIGNMLIFDVKNPSKTFTQLNNKFGPVFSVQLGRQKMVVLYGYDAVKDAFMNHAEELSERADIPIFTEATKGYGIVFSNGENWKVMRRFTISTLRDFGMGKKSMEDRISEECNSLVQIFKSYGGKPFENTTIINTAVANVIVSILLGHRYNFGDPSILKLMSLINENFKLLGSPMTMVSSTSVTGNSH
ncbi:unnamed protein product [Ranitomeya imitator]|uniref:Uncharacterized protein n=1 Tax=Ranitomeya imitator TaxID=111125 RepID=A0ABN9L9F3_9NEOB|nr:unnamed protein product [Ranitomeya imitator]